MMIAALSLALAPVQPACPAEPTATAFACRAIAADKAGQPAEAAAAFEEAARIAGPTDPVGARALAAAGNLWLAAGEAGKAARALDQSLASKLLKAEQIGMAQLDRARAAQAQDDLKTARTHVDAASATLGDDPLLWYFSAGLAIREGDKATARSSINRALSIAPNDPAILFEAGHVAHFAGDLAGARAYWNRAAQAGSGTVAAAAREALALLDAPQPVQNGDPSPK